MSRIMIRIYDGDPENYDWDEPDTPDNIGNPSESAQDYTDGEELMAAAKILELLDEGKHFDVRLWTTDRAPPEGTPTMLRTQQPRDLFPLATLLVGAILLPLGTWTGRWWLGAIGIALLGASLAVLRSQDGQTPQHDGRQVPLEPDPFARAEDHEQARPHGRGHHDEEV